MFSGLVEAKVELLEVTPDHLEKPLLLQIKVKKPSIFNDIHIGDSIAVNGVCLTVEGVNEEALQFSVGAETLKITGWSRTLVKSQLVNVERSIQWGGRVHGHLVSGHVDGMALLTDIESQGECRIFKIKIPHLLLPLVWKKGSICFNGVSLTVNEIHNDEVEVCLIPVTLERTNLSDLKRGDFVTLEVDQMARGLARLLEFRERRELSSLKKQEEWDELHHRDH